MRTNFKGFNPDTLCGLLSAFEVLQDDGPMIEGTGICENISVIVGEPEFEAGNMQAVLCTMFRAWPECHIDCKGGRSVLFPIGGPGEYLHSDRLWDGDAGAKRHRLIAWSISELRHWKNLHNGLPAGGIPLRDVGPFGAVLGVQA